jgi:hypothetical protein
MFYSSTEDHRIARCCSLLVFLVINESPHVAGQVRITRKLFLARARRKERSGRFFEGFSPCAHPVKGLKGNVFPANGIVVWKPRND